MGSEFQTRSAANPIGDPPLGECASRPEETSHSYNPYDMKIFNIGPSWTPEGSNRSFLEYLRRLRQKPGFGFTLISLTAIEGANLRTQGLSEVVYVLLPSVIGALLMGYIIWRIRFRRK